MGKIVAAMGTVHASPTLHLSARVRIPLNSMPISLRCARSAKTSKRPSPTSSIVVGSDHSRHFSSPPCPRSPSSAANAPTQLSPVVIYDLEVHQGMAEDLLDSLVRNGFDMTYSQDAVLGHSFAAV